MAIECPKCQHQNPPRSKKCKECGEELIPAKDISLSSTEIIRMSKIMIAKQKPMIGKYKILEELGKGGMGYVYKALDTTLKRTVALKFLPPELTRDEKSKARFIREAQAASGLDHPNICTIHEIDETEDGQMYISMACYEGQSLKEKIENGPLKIEEAVDIATQVAKGLDKAHKKGIIHRDIKPANIMMSEDGVVKIVDFGLAKLTGQVGLSRPDTILGTVAYMSPEQAQGEEVDHRTDIWSLGVVFYEMLSGQLPFKGNNAQSVLYSIVNKKPESIAQSCEDCPEFLQRAIQRSLQKNPDKRLQTVDEFIEALWSKADSELIKSERRSFGFPIISFQKKNHNLPIQLTSFVGREKEMAELKELISSNRLVTLTGTGGCGKTRLSLQVAADLVVDYPDGVWFVEFAPIAESRFVPEAVAKSLQVKEEPDLPLQQTLAAYLKDKSLMLLLDNCEHLVDACSKLAQELLQSCPELKILVTSREDLKIPGEVTWMVPSLTLPAPEKIAEVRQLEHFEAVKLFIDRAVAIRSKFELSSRNAPAVAQICRTLDGIPLAIELAAARIKLFSSIDILKRLEDRFQLLTSGERTRLERHKTLRATVDWSYELLSDQEQTLFNRLSVFAGDFDMEAVEEICVGESLVEKEILDLFSMLVDKSLIVVDTQADGSVRYRLLETLRQYGQEKLKESDEEESARSSHFHHYLNLADRAYDEQFEEQSKWLICLEMEHDNLRAALDYAASHPEHLLQLAGALGWFWMTHAHYTSGLHYLKTALKRREGRTAQVARTLYSLGSFWIHIPDVFSDALPSLEESVRIWRELDNEKEAGLALIEIGLIDCFTGDFSNATRCAEESLEIFKKLDDQRLVAKAKTILGYAYICQFLPDQAEPVVEETLAAALKFQMPKEISYCRHMFADCALLRGDYLEAQARYGDALNAAMEMGNIVQSCTEMRGMAMAYAGQSRYQKALRLDGAVVATYEEKRVSLPPLKFWYESLAKTVGHAKKQVGEKETSAFEEEGRAMGFEKALEYALDFDRD